MSLDFPNSPTVGQQFLTWQWDGAKWTSAGTSSGGGPFLPTSGGTINNVAPAVPALTINTGDNGPTCDNGLEVVQGYNSGNLAMGHGLTPHTASVRFGTETFNDHFAKVFNAPVRATGQYNNLESVLTIPASPDSASLVSALGTSVENYNANTGALAATFYATAGVNNSVLWGLNTVVTDSPTSNSGAFTNVREQIECDYFVRNNTTTVRGIIMDLSATVPQLNFASWIAYQTALFPGSYPWSVAFASGSGSSQVALIVGSMNLASPGVVGDLSQQAQFLYSDNTSATQRAIYVYADPTYAGSTGADLRFNSSYAGRANLTLDNLAYLKGMNAAGNATLALAVLNGSNQLSIGDGVTTTLIRGNNGGNVVSTAIFNAAANAVNVINFTGAAAGSPPTINVFHATGGTDTNIGLNISTFGASSTLALQTGGAATTTGGSLTVGTGTKNTLAITPGAASTNPVTLGASGTGGVQLNSNVGFNSTAPIAKPTISGACAGNTAIKALLTALASYGLVVDSTTA